MALWKRIFVTVVSSKMLLDNRMNNPEGLRWIRRHIIGLSVFVTTQCYWLFIRDLFTDSISSYLTHLG